MVYGARQLTQVRGVKNNTGPSQLPNKIPASVLTSGIRRRMVFCGLTDLLEPWLAQGGYNTAIQAILRGTDSQHWKQPDSLPTIDRGI